MSKFNSNHEKIMKSKRRLGFSVNADNFFRSLSFNNGRKDIPELDEGEKYKKNIETVIPNENFIKCLLNKIKTLMEENSSLKKKLLDH